MNLRLLIQAEVESQQAAAWYESEKLGLGSEFFDELNSAFEAIERQPWSFARIETMSTRRNFRRCIMKRFPYAVVFEILAAEVLVVAVAHSSRRPNYWSRRKR